VHNGSLQQNQSRLTYSYSTSAGDITGSTATATLDSRGAQPGTITVTCNVGDDRNPPLTASASTTLNMESPPPPPDVTAIERRVALHRVYFATAKPTLESPDIGLLAIQEKTLRALAGGFQIYLQSKPEARLTLQGHADPRGSVEYNQALSERLVERTKRFLVMDLTPTFSSRPWAMAGRSWLLRKSNRYLRRGTARMLSSISKQAK
jgi:outer membrane protein OmpA-like peptidoglycan-associated protein